MRSYIFLFLLLPFLAQANTNSPPASADCAPHFSTLFSSFRKTTKAEFRRRVEEIEKMPVSDIFPESLTRKGGKKVARVTEANKQKFNELFDEYWDGRSGGYLIPKSEIAAYRSWLKSKNGRAYPPIDPELLFQESTVNPPYSIGSHFDDQFLEYLYESKRVTVENVKDYVQTIDPSALRRWLIRSKKIGAKTGEYVLTAMLTAAILQFSSIPGDMAASAVNGLSQSVFGQTPKEYLSGKSKEITTTVGTAVSEQVRDWNLLFAGGEEKYVSTLLALKMASRNLDALDFDSMQRADAMKALEDFKTFTSEKLPLFRDLLLSENKDFESFWNNRLQELKQATIAVNLNYQQYKIALDRIKSDIAGRQDAPTPEELELLAEYSREMASAETFLANSLADWMFYKQARGSKNLIEAALDSNFSMVYNSYMRTMSPGLLADAINGRVVDHVSQLEKYSKKAAGKLDEIPAGPDKKPEDQLKDSTEEILRPDPNPPFGGPR